MAALQRVPAYVSPDQSDQQMPYYNHHRKLHPFHHMYTAVRSKRSGKMIKEQILTHSLPKSTIVDLIIRG
jgi:hypothetical protein